MISANISQLLIAMVFTIVLTACASTSVSREALDQARIQVISHAYTPTFEATLAAIQGQGFSLSTNDQNRGTLEGFIDFTYDLEIRGNYIAGYDRRSATAMYVEANLVRIDESNTRVEINLIEAVPAQLGSSYQTQQTDNTRRQVRNLELYEAFFSDIRYRLN